MRIHLIAVGERMPGWVQQGYQEYAKRLPPECGLHLAEIAPGKRGKGASVARAVHDEGERMLAAIPRGSKVVALEVDGRPWRTGELAQRLEEWMRSGSDIALLVGGPDGLSPACRARANEQWSLSPLTLPHPLVRIVLAEQLYRAWSILKGHPYHRG
ncbi:MAG: 23S rRNA (pseudouridine(1915)-N(3))-methyltransferase RlmH [Gammaproteobacteria bacterium]|nr:23S rRNA (pseudouridine(1915)-N(3))-methyltransferase RlmH [Gammaproteobacteria bacterium]